MTPRRHIRCYQRQYAGAATPDAAGATLLTQAAERMRLSARGYTRVLKVARTIADLAGAQSIGKAHIGEALSYRRIAHL